MADRQDNELDRLMQRAAAGDDAAFRRFYDATSPAILAFLVRLLRDRFLAEDVLQETMVIAWKKASDFDPSLAAAKTWITTIARRRALDLIRSRSRHAEILDDGARDIRAVLGHEPSRSAETESGRTDERLVYCMGQLNTEAAACIQFAYLDGLTFSEIAAQIERSLGTVKSWIRRGLDKLKACMQA
jgi:RNA polymerase sigma-70 factor (ECF subfamily)